MITCVIHICTMEGAGDRRPLSSHMFSILPIN